MAALHDSRPRGVAELDAAQVELRGVSKAFRSRGRRTVAFEDVSLTIAPGEFVCLVGPSGCGKSTLLRVLAGTLAADEGVALVGGEPVSGPSPDRGMLFQSPMLYGWLTTRRNVLFGPHAQRSRGLDHRDDAEIEADADAILDTVGLSAFADAYPHQLSGGMRHRAAFARAIATRPALLLMDEPFGALDAITDDIEEALLLGDRVAVMGNGPGRIHEVIDVPLERPRSASDVDTAAFLTIKRRVRAALEV